MEPQLCWQLSSYGELAMGRVATLAVSGGPCCTSCTGAPHTTCMLLTPTFTSFIYCAPRSFHRHRQQQLAVWSAFRAICCLLSSFLSHRCHRAGVSTSILCILCV